MQRCHVGGVLSLVLGPGNRPHPIATAWGTEYGQADVAGPAGMNSVFEAVAVVVLLELSKLQCVVGYAVSMEAAVSCVLNDIHVQPPIDHVVPVSLQVPWLTGVRV